MKVRITIALTTLTCREIQIRVCQLGKGGYSTAYEDNNFY